MSKRAVATSLAANIASSWSATWGVGWSPWEIVHHKDGDTGNNDLSNLEVQEFGAHTAVHHLGTRKTWEAKRSMEAFALLREELKRERRVKADLLEALQTVLSGLNDSFFPPGTYERADAAISKALGPSAQDTTDSISRSGRDQ
jgi:hypothetical protein